MAKYAVGDVVRCTYDKYGMIKKDQIVTVDQVHPHKESYQFKGIINRGYWYEGGFFELVHKAAEPEANAPVRLRVLEGIGVLRKGSIVTVKKEHATTFLLEEHPGKLYKKERFERIAVAVNGVKAQAEAITNVPAPRPLKVGDKVVAVSTEVSFKKHGTAMQMTQAVAGKLVMKVANIGERNPSHVQMEIDPVNLPWGFNWDISDLVFADGSPIGGGAPVKSLSKAPNKPVEPPKKKELPDIYKELDKASGGSLNDWIVLFKGKEEYTKFFNAPCFAQFNNMNGAIERLVISLKNARVCYKVASNNQEIFEQYVDYIYNRSPWADCFINKKDIKQVLDEGYELNPEFGISRLVGAAIAIRDGYEYQNRLVVFKHFVEEGFSESVAHLLAFCLNFDGDSFNVSSMTNSHTIFDGGQVAEELFKFYREGYHLDVALKEKPIKEGKNGNYLVSKAIASWCGKGAYAADGEDGKSLKQFILKNVDKTVIGGGFNRKECVSLEAANKLAAIIQQKMEKV